MHKALFIFALFISGLAATQGLGDWAIGQDYAVRFSGRNAKGSFGGLKGGIRFDPAAPETASMDVSVDVASIRTGNKTKDRHARSADWFDAERYPYIRFVSRRVARQGEGYVAEGELTLRGITKPLSIPFRFEPQPGGGRFVGQFEVKRQDYGIEGPWTSVVVGDVFRIELRVPVVPK